MKKLFIFLMLGIFLISFSSAYYINVTLNSPTNGQGISGNPIYFNATSQLFHQINATTSYDDLQNGVVDATKWSNTSSDSSCSVGESSFIYVWNCSVVGAASGTLTTTNLSAINTINALNFRVGYYLFDSGTSMTLSTTIGGVTLQSFNSGTLSINRTYYLTRLNSSTFELYIDGAFNRTVAPSNSQLTLSLSKSGTGSRGLINMDYLTYENVTLSQNLRNSTIYIWHTNGTLANSTNRTISGLFNNLTTFNISNLNFGTYKWNVLGCSANATSSNCSFAYSNFTFNNGYIENSVTFNSSVLETSLEQFILNVTLSEDISLSSARLYYNNTYYTSTKTTSGDDTLFSNEIDIPSVSSTTVKDFFWELNLDGILYNTTINQQTINTLNLGLCNATQTTKIFNFTAALETNLTRVNPFSFEGTFEYSAGSGITTKSQSVSLPSTAEAVICVSNIDSPITLSAEIAYGFESTNLTLVNRKYFFQDATITNTTQNITLLLLDSEDATTFILKVRDNTLQPVADALIYIQRYYPGEGIFRTVQVAKTDENGASVGFYQTETVTYKHIIVKDGVVLLDTGTGGVVVGESVPFTLTFTVGDTLTPPWEFLNENSTIQTSLTYNETSELVIFSYIDPTGSANFGRLNVYQESLSNSTVLTICDTSTTGSSATITCNMSGQTGTFIAKGYVITSTNLQKIINFIIDSAKQLFDKTGAFLGWIIILTVSMAFLWNPSVAIILINCTIIFLGVIGLLVFSPITYFSIIGISIILLILFKT